MNPSKPVLIVDDQAHIRTYLRLVCEKRLAIPVVETRDAESAISFCQKTAPCLILLDINMPGMSGVAAVAKLRALLRWTPIVMLTVRASRGVVQECLDAGASAYLRKDTPIERVFSIIEKLARADLAREEKGEGLSKAGLNHPLSSENHSRTAACISETKT